LPGGLQLVNMEDRMMRHLRDGLPLLQQPYSIPAGQLLHKHLLTIPTEMDSKDFVETTKYWSKQKPGACIVQQLQLMDQYLEWLLPVFALDDAVAATTATTSSSASSSSSSSSSSTTGGSGSRPAPSEDEVYGHIACLVLCLHQCAGHLYSAVAVGGSTAAALGAHLLKKRTGEPLPTCQEGTRLLRMRH
jgi:hypothetical protein